MIYKLIGLLFCLSVVLACEEDVLERRIFASTTMPDGKTLYYYKDSVITLSPKGYRFPINKKNLPYDSIAGVKGIDSSEYRVKVVLTEDIPESNLKKGVVYWAKIMDCTMNIPARSNERIATFVSNKAHSGFFPDYFAKPFIYLGSSYTRGGRNNDGDVEFHTYVLRFDYGDGVRLKNTYFPCPPDSLNWHFIRYQFNNDWTL